LLRAGFSKICISPPIGAPLAGFAARHEVSKGIHDDLYARALILENAESSVAIVSVDVLALSSEFIKRVRNAIQASTGLSPDSVMIASTHTHAGPVTITTFFNPDETVDSHYMDKLAESIQEAVSTAWRLRFPARVGVGVGHVEGVGVNRRSNDQKPIDEQIGIIKVTDADANTRCVLINYSCHPTVLGPDNLQVTGDFPAFAVKEIESALGDGGFAMFVNGTQGNISMGHSSELSAIGIITPGRTFARAAELGHLLSAATQATLPSIEVDDHPTLKTSAIPVALPLKKYPAVAETLRLLHDAEANLAALTSSNGDNTDQVLRARSEYLYASINNFYAREAVAFADGMLPIELQAIRINDAVFVAVPAEVFVEIGLCIKKKAPYPTFLVGIANGYIGYLPTMAAHEVGGYEVVSSKCRPEAETELIEHVLILEQRLFPEVAPIVERVQ
jgi:neutral ceramidase